MRFLSAPAEAYTRAGEVLNGLAVLMMISVTQNHGIIWGALAYLAALSIARRIDEAIARRRPSGVRHRDLPLGNGGMQHWTLTVDRTDISDVV